MKQMKSKRHFEKEQLITNFSQQPSFVEKTALNSLIAISNEDYIDYFEDKLMKTQQLKQQRKIKPRKFSFEQKKRNEMKQLFENYFIKKQKSKIILSEKPMQKQKSKVVNQVEIINIESKEKRLSTKSVSKVSFIHRLTPSKQALQKQNISHSLVASKRILSFFNPILFQDKLSKTNTSRNFFHEPQKQIRPHTNNKLSHTFNKQSYQILSKHKINKIKEKKSSCSIIKLQFPSTKVSRVINN